jgi:hypothetical protein
MLTAELVIAWAFFHLIAAAVVFVGFPTANRLNKSGATLATFLESAAVRRIRSLAWGTLLFFFVAILLLTFVDFCLHIALPAR